MIMLVIMTGCYGQDVSVNIKDDGSGEITYGMIFEQDSYNAMLEASPEMESAIESMGFVKGSTTYNNKKYVSFTIAMTFDSLIDLQRLLADGSYLESKLKESSLSSELIESPLGSEPIINYAYITEDTFQGVLAGYGSREDKEYGLDEMYKDIINRFVITFPKEIVSTNGTLSEDKKTVTWTQEYILSDQLLQASTVENPVYPVDKKKPVIAGVKNNTYYNDSVDVELSDNTGIASATVNGIKMGNIETFENNARYRIVAKDFAGNTSTVTFYIDQTAPTVKGVENNKYYKTKRTITFSDNREVKSATLNGKAIKSGRVVSKPGKYVLKVTDIAGNVKKVTFYIDQTAPTVKGVTNGKIYQYKKTITFSDNRAVKSATLNGKKIKSGKVVSASGKYTLKVTDKAGNVRTVKFTIKKK